MNILVFDTCLDKMYVTLAKDDEIIESEIVENRDNKYHSAFLISTIKSILRKHNLKPTDINLLGTNIGPGSFTGIRACTTVARVMGQQLNIPVVGVSSLEILSHINNSEKPALVALDARKNSAYLYYEGEVKGAILLDEVKSEIATNKYFVITDNRLLPEFGQGISYQEGNYRLGDILAKLVYKKYIQSNDYNWKSLKPLYIQPPAVFQSAKSSK